MKLRATSVFSLHNLSQFSIKALALTILPIHGISHAASLPVLDQVLSGNVTFDKSDTTLRVQSTDKNNVIRWQSFDIDKGNIVFFDRYNYLNLITGGSKSVIKGEVNAAFGSKIYLVNPSGFTLEQGSLLTGSDFHLSSAKISDRVIEDFKLTGQLAPSGKGMGKITLLGEIQAQNLTVDAGQIIIRDIEKISSPYDPDTPLNNRQGEHLILKSSVKRIDIGGKAGVDLKNNYGFTKEHGLVDHTGKTAVSSKEELLEIKNNPSGSYFLTNDIDLGRIDNVLDGGLGFKGDLDGAFNTVGYDLTLNGGNQIGLFSSLDHASVSNLKIDGSLSCSYLLSGQVSSGGLAGKIIDSALSNIEILNFNQQRVAMDDTAVLSTGSIAGNIDGLSKLNNVTGSFDLATERKIQDLKQDGFEIRAGSFAGNIGALTEFTGVNAGNSSLGLKASGSGSSLKLFDSFKDAFEPGIGSTFVQKDNLLLNTGFLTPFYLDGNYSFEYDPNNPQIYDYAKLTNSDGFILQNLLNVNRDFAGTVQNPGTYSYTLESKQNGTSWYFVSQELGEKSSSGSVSITVSSSASVPVPPEKPSPNPDTPSDDVIEDDAPIPGQLPLFGIDAGFQGRCADFCDGMLTKFLPKTDNAVKIYSEDPELNSAIPTSLLNAFSD